jgi:glycosyltransferase involved in cell wall biosynthesis
LILGEESVPTFAATYMSYPTLRLALLAWAYHRATYVTAPSPGVAAQVEQDLRVPRESLCVIPNMIETAAIAREAAQPPPEELARARARGEAVIVTAGRLHPAKGQEDLLRALPILAARSGRCRLFVLGIGRDRPRLERLSRELGVESEVEFLGFVRNPYAFFANADVFVSPSHAESFGNVIIEAMAAGAPIVSTDVPAGPRWIVEDGRTGTLARARDPADLAAKIAEVLDDPVRAEAMVRHGRSFVTRFDAAEVVPQYVAVCERALRGHALGVPSAVRS